MTPVLANILMIEIFILVNDYGPEFMAAFIFTCMVAIVWHQRAALLSLFWSEQRAELAESRVPHRWVRALVVLTVATIMLTGLILMHR
jgi:hypothetical protein